MGLTGSIQKLLLFAQRQSEDMSVLAQDYPSAPANPSSLAKRDARGWEVVHPVRSEKHEVFFRWLRFSVSHYYGVTGSCEITNIS